MVDNDPFRKQAEVLDHMPGNEDQQEPGDEEKMIMRVALIMMISYKSRNRVRNRFPELQVSIDKVVMITKVRLAARQKMVLW